MAIRVEGPEGEIPMSREKANILSGSGRLILMRVIGHSQALG